MVCVVQMHGEPGSGKTTLARGLGRALSAVVLELDVITEALLRSGIETGPDGRVAYAVHYAMAENVAAQGVNVVLDNPVYRPEVEERSRRLAAEHSWRMIECVCPNGERLRRLNSRPRLVGQAVELHDWRAKPGTAEPSAARLTLDTRQPLDELIAAAMAYVVSPPLV